MTTPCFLFCFHLPHDCVTAGFWIVSMNLWECGVRLAHCDRGSWLGGALVSALCICCFLAHRFPHGTFVLLFRFCSLCHTNPLGDTLGRPFWAKPVLRRFSGPRIGSVGGSFLMIWFLVGASGVHIDCCLNPVEGSFLLFRFVWWLDCLLLKEGASAFCSLRWLLEVFLAVESLWVFAKVAVKKRRAQICGQI